MKADAMGFLYPEVDSGNCIKCGLCKNVCSFHESYDKSFNNIPPSAYGVRHKNPREMESSRSGAAFIALSDEILNRGGVIYGAGYYDHFRVAHKRAETREQRNEFKGSKYVQSDMNTVFRQVRDDLQKGLPVLFSGTACQTSGLRSFIKKSLQTNLYLVDIVCFGTPSPYIWRDYLLHVEKQTGKQISSINFRNKQLFGWASHQETCTFEDGSMLFGNIYQELFFRRLGFRPSCEKCHFCNTVRPSDVTLADFWGWEKSDPEFNADNKGCSLLLCNTPKGEQLFASARAHVNSFPVRLDACLQPALMNPLPFPPNHKKFEQDYLNRGFEYAVQRQGLAGWNAWVRRYAGKARNRLVRCLQKLFLR